MNRLNQILDHFFPPAQPIPPGIYHYQAPPDAQTPLRMHLRLETDGQGVLIVNASTVLHLNQTAAEFAYYLVQGKPEGEAVAEVARRYHVSKEKAAQDYQELTTHIQTISSTNDLDPVMYLNFDRLVPYSKQLSAPYRLDCALTYRTSSGESNLSPLDRVRRELLTDEWNSILDKAWNAGIPHVIFTGGEPTLRSDLCDLIRHAEELGMVAGVISDGLRLTDKDYMHDLLNSGLDHLMLLLDTEDEQSWEALRDAQVEDIFTSVHLTLSGYHRGEVPALLERLQKMGVKSISLTADDVSLKEVVKEAGQLAATLGFSMVGDMPVPYSRFHPLSLELAENQELPDGAARAWLYVEPDGDVLPAQGHPMLLGNFLTDSWEHLWNKPIN